MLAIHQLQTTSAYIILIVFIGSAIALISSIIHLSYVATQKSKHQSKSKRDTSNNKKILFLIILTLMGIVSFLISILLMIAVIFQIILLDGHRLDPTKTTLDEFYYVSEPITDYFIVLFDQFGHLSMLSVFVVRLKMCFTNSVFGYSQNMMRLIYICLIVLSTASFIIVVQIMTNVNAQHIIISQIIWELLIEIMCIWLLYLFVSKLHSLLQMASTTFMVDICIEPQPLNHVQQHANEMITHSNPEKLSIPRTPKRVKHSAKSELNNQNLVNVMLKMTLLVLIAVSGSILSVIGNVFIEIHELQAVQRNTPDIQRVFTFLLPAIDIVLTAFMLYLQFDFTKNVYSTMCSKIDKCFIECFMFVGRQVSDESDDELEIEAHDEAHLEQEMKVSSVKSGLPTPTNPQYHMQNMVQLSVNTTAVDSEYNIPDDVLRLISPSPSPMPPSFIICEESDSYV